MEAPAYLTLREASVLLRAAPRTLHSPYSKRRLSPFQVGLRLLVPRAAVERLLQRGTEMKPHGRIRGVPTWLVDVVEKALHELKDGEWIQWDGTVVWIVEALANDTATMASTGVHKNILGTLAALPPGDIPDAFRRKYITPYQSQDQTESQEQTQDHSEEQSERQRERQKQNQPAGSVSGSESGAGSDPVSEKGLGDRPIHGL